MTKTCNFDPFCLDSEPIERKIRALNCQMNIELSIESQSFGLIFIESILVQMYPPVECDVEL